MGQLPVVMPVVVAAVADAVEVAAVASPMKGLVHRSRVEVACREADMDNLEETFAGGEGDIHQGHRMEEADIGSYHIQEVVEDTDALEDRRETAVSAAEEQKSTINMSS